VAGTFNSTRARAATSSIQQEVPVQFEAPSVPNGTLERQDGGYDVYLSSKDNGR
jgi:hypothetical protein